MPTPNPSDAVAARIRDLLDERGLTRGDLAGRMDVSRNTVSNWTRGIFRPGREHSYELARVLGTSVDDILGRQQSPQVLPPATNADPRDALIRRLASLNPDPAARELAAFSGDLMAVLREAQAYIAERP